MTASASQATLQRYRWLFLVAAVYDLALGIAFFILGTQIFEWLAMEPVAHISYIHLPAVFVAVQGFSYMLVWQDPLANLGIVKVGIVYKAGYALLAGYYLLTDQIPAMFFAWFGLFDFLFLIGFVMFLRWATRPASRG
jgi:hypothetical protein